MGVLDDAIREHLELKRQHGVAEEEVRRQEEEALGPARRDVAPAEGVEGEEAAAEPQAAESSAEPEAVEPEADAPKTAEPEADAPESAEPEADVSEPVEPEADVSEAADVEVLDGEPVLEETAAEPEPSPPIPFDAEVDPSPSEDQTVIEEPTDEAPAPGFEALDDDELPDEPEGEERADADVLEDTPDFLQETPEHDRLWFEQKPPRDFDFD